MRFAVSLLITLSAVASAQTPSFDCSRAQTPREHTLCADPRLADVDARMSTAYHKLEASLSPAGADAVKTDQRQWLQWLDKVCPPAGDQIHDASGCLLEHYNTRLRLLSAAPLRIGGLSIYPRAHYVFVAANPKPADQRPGNDPGYGWGEFTWPQIDNPTPSQRAWNDAVYAAMISASGIGERRPRTLDEAAGSDGYIDDFFIISAADIHFIDVQLGSSSYGWGAAHPNSSIGSFSWWLSQGRALQADDIFASNSGWQETMVPLTLAKLQQEPGPDALWGPKYGGANLLRDAIASGIAHPGYWTVSADGLTITYGSYAVGPYSSGMPSAHFTWQELRPMLAPGFDPASLPPLIESPN
jgi:uncharacterized protein